MRKFIARFRQAPMFSTVYILGAALSVASVMLVAIFLHVKTSNIYPEYSRDRLLYNNYIALQFEDNTISGNFSPVLASTIIDSIGDIANVALELYPDKYVSVYVDGKKFENIKIKSATPGIFSVYDYEFIEGQPFPPETTELLAVISDNLARKIFGTDRNVVGRKFRSSEFSTGYFGRMSSTNTDFTVCGVFKEGSRLLPLSFAEIISPVNLNLLIEQYNHPVESDYDTGDLYKIVGDLNIITLPKSGVSKEEVTSRINEAIAREATTPKKWIRHSRVYHDDGVTGTIIDHVELQPGEYQLTIGAGPRGALEMNLGEPPMFEEFDFAGFMKLYGLIVMVLLLVPALNLSSLISGNMDSKMSEMGIRKAFGARNSTLLRQVVNENLWLTGCGAILGIILAWVGVLLWKDWLFAGIGSEEGSLSASDVMLDPAMLFAPKVFIAAVIICVVLNLLSSLIPAWWALRRPAIDAIKAKS
ncbi:MAG: FtsX-like permease family protein [Bacteroides sp.]|nr:FtsX-like permease family protein [Bacteroides sp.]